MLHLVNGDATKEVFATLKLRQTSDCFKVNITFTVVTMYHCGDD